MEGRGIGYWGPAIATVGVIALLVSLLVFRDAALYWALALSALVVIAGAVLIGYRRIG